MCPLLCRLLNYLQGAGYAFAKLRKLVENWLNFFIVEFFNEIVVKTNNQSNWLDKKTKRNLIYKFNKNRWYDKTRYWRN